MRAVVQRVRHSHVNVDGTVVGEIGRGLLVLLGVEANDADSDLDYLANKIVSLRIFEDDQGKMNRSVADVGGQVLVVSQFTLLGDARKGNRPSFIRAADPEKGNELYQAFCQRIRERGIDVQTGRFQAHMEVELVNSGPVTILLDSTKLF